MLRRMMTLADADAVPTGDETSRRVRIGLLLAGALVGAGYLKIELLALAGRLGWPLDDSWIHLQFARNLAAGHGLSYNPGELVTGSTAPLWTALLALLSYLPGNLFLWVQLAGILLYLLGIDATWRLARELGLPPGRAALAGCLTLCTGWLAWSALSGMEVPLFVALSLWGTILHIRERAADLAELAGAGERRVPLAPAVLAIAALARPEGLMLLVFALLDRLLLFTREAGAPAGAAGVSGEPGTLRWRRPRFADWALGGLFAACVLVGPLLFYRIAGGSFLPTTFAAKGGQLRHWLPSAYYVYTVLGILMRAQPFATLLCCGGVATLVARLGSRRDRGLLPGLWLIGLPLAYSTISPEDPASMLGGNFGRYYFPLFPFVVVIGVLGLDGAADMLAAWRHGLSGQRRLAGLVTALLVLAMLWPTVGDLVDRGAFYARNLHNVDGSDVRAALWLARRLPADAVLAVNDIGAFKYLLPNRIVDIAGIANPELRQEFTQRSAHGVPWDQAIADAVARRHPDYIAIFPRWLPRLESLLSLKPVLRLHIANNITMGGDDVVVYSTPWTRQPLRRLPGDPG
jgi:hypothetical protein